MNQIKIIIMKKILQFLVRLITCSRRISRCLMWNKWASRVVLLDIIWDAALAKAAQAAAKTSLNYKAILT